MECKQEPGVLAPVVNRGDCEAKRKCEEACPYHVFEVRPIEDDDYRALGIFARFKVRAHGMKSAYTPRAADCRACAQCVEACPEDAIKLARR